MGLPRPNATYTDWGEGPYSAEVTIKYRTGPHKGKEFSIGFEYPYLPRIRFNKGIEGPDSCGNRHYCCIDGVVFTPPDLPEDTIKVVKWKATYE